jgi:NTP pyrophosphatase (non-canonical NTP hydrolase)
MTFAEYEAAAARTDESGELAAERDIVYHVLKIAGEAGEIANLFGKARGQGHTIDTGKVILESGDVLWHLARLVNRLGYTLADVARMNVAKINTRYPEGFTVDASVNRKTED